MAWSLMKARVRPSANCTRRRILISPVSSSPLSLRIFEAGLALRHIEHRGDLALFHAMTDEAGVAAAAERQRKGIEQDRFARAGFAGQHRQAAGKLDIEPFDQDDVTDRQTGQHAK